MWVPLLLSEFVRNEIRTHFEQILTLLYRFANSLCVEIPVKNRRYLRLANVWATLWDTHRVTHILYYSNGCMVQRLFLMSVFRPHCSFSADAGLIRGKYAGYFVGGSCWLVNYMYFNMQWSLWRNTRMVLFLKLDVSLLGLPHIHHNKGICHLRIIKRGQISKKGGPQRGHTHRHNFMK